MKKKENNEMHKPDRESFNNPIPTSVQNFLTQIGCQLCILNPRCSCAVRVWVLGLSVCLSICGTSGYEAVNKWYQRLQCYKFFETNVALFRK